MKTNQDMLGSYISDDTLRNIQKGIERELDDNYKERYIKKMGGEIEFETVTRSGREDNEILKFAKDEKVDLIVMGTHGKTGIEHVFFGSVAEKVIRHSPFPVFITPDRKKLERF